MGISNHNRRRSGGSKEREENKQTLPQSDDL